MSVSLESESETVELKNRSPDPVANIAALLLKVIAGIQLKCAAKYDVHSYVFKS